MVRLPPTEPDGREVRATQSREDHNDEDRLRSTRQAARGERGGRYVAASRPNGQAALAWADPFGFLSGQGAGLGWPLALDEAARGTDHVLRVSRALLDANRAAADAMRDLVRSQQDLAFETCRAGYTALCGQSDNGAAIAWERAAARFGYACGRSIQAMLSLGNPGTEVRDDATSDGPSGAEVRPRGA